MAHVTLTSSAIITKNITVTCVPYMPKLNCNLPSINKLTKDLTCVTKFLPNLCEFQIFESGKTINICDKDLEIAFQILGEVNRLH